METNKYNVVRPGQYNYLKLSGKYDIKARYPDGKVVQRSGKNLVTDSGEKLVATLLDVNGTETAPNFIAFGSGTDPALKTDTQLQTEIGFTREEVDSTVQATNTIAMTWNITVGATYTIQEMAILNASVAGTMFSRFLTQELDVVSGVVIDIVWTLTISGVD